MLPLWNWAPTDHPYYALNAPQKPYSNHHGTFVLGPCVGGLHEQTRSQNVEHHCPHAFKVKCWESQRRSMFQLSGVPYRNQSLTHINT